MPSKTTQTTQAAQPKYSNGMVFVFGKELNGFLRIVNPNDATSFCRRHFYDEKGGRPLNDTSTGYNERRGYYLDVAQEVLDDFAGYEGDCLKRRKVRRALCAKEFEAKFNTGQYVLFKMLNQNPWSGSMVEEFYVLCSVGKNEEIHWPNEQYGPLGRNFSAVPLEKRVQEVLGRARNRKGKGSDNLVGISPEEALVIWAYKQGLETATRRTRKDTEEHTQEIEERNYCFFNFDL